MGRKWLDREMERVEYYEGMKQARKTGKPLPKRPKGVPEPLKDPLLYPKRKKR